MISTDTNTIGHICSYTWREYNNYGSELIVNQCFGNEDVSDCLTMASIIHKLKQKHSTPSEFKVKHGDFVVLSIMEINQ